MVIYELRMTFYIGSRGKYMTLKEQLVKILERHNHSPSAPDDVLFKLHSPYCLHKTLAQDSPYLENEEGVNPAYVARCMDIATDVYSRLGFGAELLVVYEDCYGENNQDEIHFVESCLKGIGDAEAYSFSWKFRPMEGTYPAALANNTDVHICSRKLYQAKEIDIQRLFREIILSDIGGKYNLDSKIFIIDTATGAIFHLYDDRGLWVSGQERIYFPQLGTEHDQISDMEYKDISDAEAFFSIQYEDFEWIGGAADDPEDLCLHGMVSVRMGAESFAYPCCASAAALRMLKTLTEDHEVTNSGEQMLPCCGHFMLANQTRDNVYISGCDYGIDWTVRHEEGGIRLITATGRQVVIDPTLYRSDVLKFADAVEAFYKSSSPKFLPENGIDREGYQAFWNEWHRRRKEAGKMKIEISKDEALVLYDFLYRANQNELIVFEDQAEQRVLWNLEAALEKQLVEPAFPNYLELVQEARNKVRDSLE